MPYKRVGTTVYVKKDGKWVVLKKHGTEAGAERHRRALEANVKHR